MLDSEGVMTKSCSKCKNAPARSPDGGYCLACHRTDMQRRRGHGHEGELARMIRKHNARREQFEKAVMNCNLAGPEAFATDENGRYCYDQTRSLEQFWRAASEITQAPADTCSSCGHKAHAPGHCGYSVGAMDTGCECKTAAHPQREQPDNPESWRGIDQIPTGRESAEIGAESGGKVETPRYETPSLSNEPVGSSQRKHIKLLKGEK